ncbi:MAG: peptidase M75 [Saprospiraceae bacterium]|nr:peptidase M75 [Saprospiraceae bacterium]
MNKSLLLLPVIVVILFSACGKKKIKTLKDDVVSNYVTIVYASYEDSYNEAVELKTALENLVNTPSQATLDAAKTAWKEAREPYGQTEVYRFYDGPIDDADGPEGNLNAWPLDENYIDYVTDANGVVTATGIIHNIITYPNITAEVLGGANEQGSEKNISIGYHAIEFLLWGQDFADVNQNVGQGGNRPFTDYSTDPMATRRGQYLLVCADLLIADLASLKAEWEEGGAYRTSFLALDTDEAISKILTGAGILSKSELAGERMFVALEANAANNPQEDEHSCFADNTHRDIITNAQGINNVLSGTYTSVNGTVVGNADHSIIKLVELVDETAATSLSAAMATALTNAEAIPVPFDKYVTEESVADNGPILQSIQALQAQGDQIAAGATALGLTISTDLPE